MDQVSRALLAVGGGVAEKTYVDDVFSTYLYTGNGSTQTITNGIDLAGRGGLVWTRQRNSINNHWLYSTAQGTGGAGLLSNTADTITIYSAYNNIQSFNADGFSLGIASSGNQSNPNGGSCVSWTFRKAPNFFDVVTYTGNGTGSSRTLNHSLGSTPGLYVIKATSTTGDWYVGVPSLGVNYWINLNSNANAGNNTSYWQSATSTTFGPQNTGGTNILNVNGVSYVAYLFAHDTSADGLIQCGSFTTDGSGNASVTSLGWEPQFLLVRASSVNGDWIMLDSMRGWNMTAADARLLANSSGAESTATNYGNPTATGFSFSGGSASATYIYMAIRRPNKPPTTGTSVFSPVAAALNSTDVQTSGFPVDMVIAKQKNGTNPPSIGTRMLGGSYLRTDLTSVEALWSYIFFDKNTGYYLSSAGTFFNAPTTANWMFRRAPGFFDVVCYTGTGAAGNSVSHNLGVKPELAIFKARSAAEDFWYVLTSMGATSFVRTKLNSNDLQSTSGYASLTHITAEPTASSFSLGWQSSTNSANTSGVTYVAYLFASLPGISKIGTYTGNGTFQTIDCGFTTGARFVLIKRTDATGDWYVFDTARGIVLGVDPALALNSTAAEVTLDVIDPNSSGFTVEANPSVPINATSATYIYLAIA